MPKMRLPIAPLNVLLRTNIGYLKTYLHKLNYGKNVKRVYLLTVITGKSGVSIEALLVRQCPDPPEENDPDTDDEESKHEDEKILINANMVTAKCSCSKVVIQRFECGLIVILHPVRPWIFQKNNGSVYNNRQWR